MNVSDLRSVLERVLNLDQKFKLQESVDLARDSIINMVNAPHDPNHQTAFSDAIKQLKDGYIRFSSQLTPADWERIEKIRADVEFSDQLVNSITSVISENAVTPAVVRDKLVELSESRKRELEHYKRLLDELDYVGFEAEENNINEAQVGFKIPRSLFDNDLSGFIKELSFIKKFIRLVSEAGGDAPENIRVGSISTSDPLIWFILSSVTVVKIGSLTKWCLDTWKQVEEIKALRSQTAKNPMFSPKEVEDFFDRKIKDLLETAIKEKADELVAPVKDGSRRSELTNGLTIQLDQFLARTERGMTVEVRYIPPPPTKDTNEAQREAQSSMQKEIRELSSSLKFTRHSGDPIMLLETKVDHE